MPLGMNIASADGSSTALISSSNFQRGESTNQFQAESETESTSEGEGGGLAFTNSLSKSEGTSRGLNKNRGTSQAAGSSEALYPVFENLPTSFHSKENELYMHGEMIRNLPVGRAILKFRSNATTITIPPPRKTTSP